MKKKQSIFLFGLKNSKYIPLFVLEYIWFIVLYCVFSSLSSIDHRFSVVSYAFFIFDTQQNLFSMDRTECKEWSGCKIDYSSCNNCVWCCVVFFFFLNFIDSSVRRQINREHEKNEIEQLESRLKLEAPPKGVRSGKKPRFFFVNFFLCSPIHWLSHNQNNLIKPKFIFHLQLNL